MLYRDAVAGRLWGEVRSFHDYEIKNAWPQTYVAEGLLFSRALAASYTALYAEELQVLESGSAEATDALARLGQADARVVASLTRGKLPQFAHVHPSTLVRVRENDVAFADFRDVLRDFARQLVAGVEDPSFDAEVHRLSRDYLEPALQQVSASGRWGTELRSHASGAAIDFAAGVIGGFAVSGDLLTGAATGAVSGVAKILLQQLAQRKAGRPAAQIILSLSTPEHRRGAPLVSGEARLRRFPSW